MASVKESEYDIEDGASSTEPPDHSTDLVKRHECLKSSHLRLKGALKCSVRKSLETHVRESDTTKEFADKAMSTISAYMMSQMCNEAISLATEGISDDKAVQNLVNRAIYAGLVLVFVPVGLWVLRNTEAWAAESHKLNGTILADQMQLLNLSLPMFFAWGWKDFVAAIIGLKQEGHILWPELLVASGLTLIIAFCGVLPCYRRAHEDVAAGGKGDTIFNRILTMPGSLGLATGFAWNEVCAWASKDLQKQVQAPLFKMMVQIAYFVIIGGLVTTVYLRWHRKPSFSSFYPQPLVEHLDHESHDGAGVTDKQKRQSFRSFAKALISKIERCEARFLMQVGKVVMDALEFVYAWAQLDTINAFFFSYGNGCGSPKTCSYQLNLVLAGSLTIVFTRWATLLKSERRFSAWNQAATALTTKAISLNVGWAWSNYSYTAIENAVETARAPRLMTHVVCAAFAWFLISVMHRKFEIERRAWDRHIQEETVNHGLGVCGVSAV